MLGSSFSLIPQRILEHELHHRVKPAWRQGGQLFGPLCCSLASGHLQQEMWNLLVAEAPRVKAVPPRRSQPARPATCSLDRLLSLVGSPVMKYRSSRQDPPAHCRLSARSLRSHHNMYITERYAAKACYFMLFRCSLGRLRGGLN